MIEKSVQRLEYLCSHIPPLLSQLSKAALSWKPDPVKWSKKEILGHLIDSAANNHQRFVRGQYENAPTIFYDQDEWVKLQAYQSCKKEALISLWESYNRHLVHILSKIPKQDLSRTCKGKDGSSVTLQFLADDYVVHLEHHLKQIIEY